MLCIFELDERDPRWIFEVAFHAGRYEANWPTNQNLQPCDLIVFTFQKN